MMTAMAPAVLARRRRQDRSLAPAAGATGIALVLSLATWIAASIRRGEAPSEEPVSLGIGAVLLGLYGLAMAVLGRRRLGVAWAVSGAVLSAGALVGLGVDLGVDAMGFEELDSPRARALGAAGLFGRLCVAAGLGAAVLAASVLVGRRGPPRRALVRVGAACIAVVLMGVALDPGSVEPNLNDYYGPNNPLAPQHTFQLAALLLRLGGAVGLGGVAVAGLLPLAGRLIRSRLLQGAVAGPALAGSVALASGVRWPTVVAVAAPTALAGAEFCHGAATTTVSPVVDRNEPGSLDRAVLSGLGFGRVVALAWAVVLAVAGATGSADLLRHAPVPWPLLMAAGVVTVAQLVKPGPLDSRRCRGWVAAEVAVGLALAAAGPSASDRLADAGSLPFPGWPWPLVGVVATGIVFGPTVGAGWGAALGLVRLVVEISTSFTTEDMEVLNLVNTVALYALGGALAGLVVGRLRRAEAEVAAARAREEVARALHDGVMQSLAVIRRRAEPEVARIAADADRELRSYLARGDRAPEGLAEVLREAADAVARTHGIEPALALDPELPELTPERLAVVRGVVAEALANAAKHAGATNITVYAGPDLVDQQVMVSVRDDGVGFDVDRVPGDRGLARSIRARAAEAHVRVEIRSEPGRGSEVCLWP